MSKITQKQLNGYYKARKEIISNNDDYNKDFFKITLKEYMNITKAFSNLFGMFGNNQTATLAAINRELQRIN